MTHGNVLPTKNLRVSFSYLKHTWESGQQKVAFEQLKHFPLVKEDLKLQARVYLKCGEWQTALEGIEDNNLPQIINSYQGTLLLSFVLCRQIPFYLHHRK